ncbi:acetyl-CoA hydrolase/transferase family protein [Vagococcus salmoninarum]|uniref:acetyl-CoA hydrolase/transferase family protein n=1 Tax=Vagococcus salmoninarum TaxID=2739 RepID=UPI001881701E|nr:acetyl-CoA hydrolase/transferase family protein [Vagococcus salmoninarum]MBE9389976.1 acetyl-CoA hydrolase/transferase family protein [Vagococcus salmoninarum]
MKELLTKYNEKKVSATEAITFLAPGDAVVYPIAPGEPKLLHDALCHYEGLDNNKLYRTLTNVPTYDLPKDKLKQISIFLGGDRQLMNDGVVELLPNHFGDTVDLIKMREEQIVLMFNASPMDDKGYFSLSLANAYVGGLLDVATKIIIEVNENCPYTYGVNHHVHIDDVTALIESSEPLPTVPEPVIDEKSEAIGKIIADLVPDGATLQIGYGSVPSAVMNNLTTKRQLGFHTEMLPDNVIELYNSGALDNSQKETYIGKTVTTFAMGSPKLYQWLDKNEDIYFVPVNQSNAVKEIAKEDNLYTINATIQVDLLGQCNSEKLPNKYYSSTGGQSDFGKGVRMTTRGVGIIALNSTAAKDSISTIVPSLYNGAAVTTSKNDVDYIVTEYGAARMKGKTINERVEALIAIAHPKFRDELRAEAQALKYLAK